MRFETFGIKHLLPLVKGMGVTLEVCLITLVLGTILGLMAGIALTSRIRPLRAACKAYVNIVRGIPLLVILPQAVRVMIPPLVGFFIALVKDSSLVSAIGYIDLTRSGKIVGNLTMNPMLSFVFVAVFYFVICYSLSRLARYSERKLQINLAGGKKR